MQWTEHFKAVLDRTQVEPTPTGDVSGSDKLLDIETTPPSFAEIVTAVKQLKNVGLDTYPSIYPWRRALVTPATVEQACRQVSEAGVQLSLVSGRRCAALPPLYELAGGDLHKQHQRNYAKVDT
ncbi:unnamed protein product [Plutella xylostella]|uniref:(diamondback moth) hypothetical protein n=1 Tax=Plutella xylostella TaxID=51655 RepID=A0A8S4F7K3_PLUXY|nr:unnamed protein product [Plutella xylostella]